MLVVEMLLLTDLVYKDPFSKLEKGCGYELLCSS